MNEKKGFTLIELMITASIASIVAMAAGSMLVSSFREAPIQQQMFDRETSAFILMETMRKQVRSGSYNDAALLTEGVKLVGPSGTNMVQKIEDSLYYQRGDKVTTLIDGGVHEFNVEDIDGTLRCSLKMLAHKATNDEVTYQFAYAFRN